MKKQLRIERFKTTENSTIGMLFVDNVFVCFTLELAWRGNAPKRSCIPAGRYPIVFRNDPGSKYKYLHLHVRDVPGREWILFHIGNFPKDTLGCVLPGLTHGLDSVGGSTKAFNKLMDHLKGATQMSLTIENKTP
jgi:hypothetical protein